MNKKSKSLLGKLQSAKTSNGWFEGIIQCSNKNCVTAQSKEPVRRRFKIVRLEPVTIQCYYCGRYVNRDELLAQLG